MSHDKYDTDHSRTINKDYDSTTLELKQRLQQATAQIRMKEKTERKKALEKESGKPDTDNLIKKRKYLHKQLKRLWEFQLAKRSHERSKNGKNGMWTTINLLEAGKTGKNPSTQQQGMKDEKGILKYGEGALAVFQKLYKKLGDPKKTKQKYFNMDFEKEIIE